MLRIGQGFDIHPFASDRPLVLGGVVIPYEKGLAGVTDGDALLHAVIDALLGASGAGDLGRRFPASDPQLQGADSSGLLQEVVKEIYSSRFTINNIDCTILAEAPKMVPYIAAMEKQIATCCQIAVSQVNLKAKTMEQLGVIGHQEAIAAQVVVLLDTNS